MGHDLLVEADMVADEHGIAHVVEELVHRLRLGFPGSRFGLGDAVDEDCGSHAPVAQDGVEFIVETDLPVTHRHRADGQDAVLRRVQPGRLAIEDHVTRVSL